MVKTKKANLKKTFENSFYNKITPILNKIAGLGTNDQFSIGMFLKLGINFEFEYDKEVGKIGETRTPEEQIKELFKRLSAYVKLQDDNFEKNSAVVIKIRIKDDNELEEVLELLEEPAVVSFMAFVYLHEVQHILRKHNTEAFNSLMKNVILKTKGSEFIEKIGDQGVHKFLNIAEDYAINYALIDLFGLSTDTEVEKLGFLVSNSGILYKTKYVDKSEIDILKIILDDDEIVQNITEYGVGQDGRLGDLIEDLADWAKSQKGKKKSNNTSDDDKELDAMASAIQKVIDKNAGKAGFKLAGLVKNSIKVDVRWFDRLQQGFYNFVNKKTKNSVANWNNLDNKLRHVYKAPTRKNIEKTVDLVVSVDQSGSISYDSLGKLLYLFEKKAKSIDTLTMLFHDTEIAHVDVFEGRFNAKEVVASVKARHCGGGTSHKEVFKWLDENISKRDLKRKIFISFSDNYSDIEQEYNNYSAIKGITKIWLNSDGRDVDKNIGGLRVQFN
jgi:hypothetical protein